MLVSRQGTSIKSSLASVAEIQRFAQNCVFAQSVHGEPHDIAFVPRMAESKDFLDRVKEMLNKRDPNGVLEKANSQILEYATLSGAGIWWDWGRSGRPDFHDLGFEEFPGPGNHHGDASARTWNYEVLARDASDAGFEVFACQRCD